MGGSDYLSVADVLGMHTVLMQRYGGAAGVRDPGALESALYRPQTGYYEDIVAEAAALLESLAINHPFIDGNKRIAFAAADVFLRINGWRLQRPPMQICAEMIQMFESGTFDIARLEPWLRGFASAAERMLSNARTRAAKDEAPVMMKTRAGGHAELFEESPMSIESLPTFSQPARQRWESILADTRQRLLANVWCGHCRRGVTMTNFSGTIKRGDLLLVGKCAECHGDVARLIEGS